MVVIPTIVGIWLIVEAIIAFFKGNRLGLIFPIIGSNITWVALLEFLLGLVILSIQWLQVSLSFMSLPFHFVHLAYLLLRPFVNSLVAISIAFKA